MVTQEKIQPIQLTVSKIIRETPDVKTFRLSWGTLRPFEFLPGQFIVLGFEIFDPEKGRIVRKNRAFSISSSPTEVDHLDITVKKTGRVTTYMHEQVKEGDPLTVKSRSGDFYFQEGLADELVLIAGGTGVAPLMSIVRYVCHRRLPVKITLIYSNKTPEDIIFYQELKDLESQNPLFRCIHTITRPEGHSWEGLSGRIDQDLLRRNLPRHEALYFICGPESMIQSTVGYLKGLSVDPARIKLEKWD